MPPKSAARGTASKTEDAKEDPLRAVIVADTFETKFAPFTLERPRCLLPLANVPLIEYTLEFLASAGVVEVYVYAGAHVDQVETYINASKWKMGSSPFKRFDFLRCQAGSVGDVMRDLDQKGYMGTGGDFVVVSGDVVSDFPVERALRRHRERREQDKNAIMTMILRARGPREFVSEDEMVPTFVVEPSKERCLHYEESRAGKDFGTHIDPEVLKSPEIDIRQDLIDCRIDICTPDVLSLWSDNFDNQAPRKDFLHGVLKDYELNGKTIHTYVVDDYYANRAGDLKSYVDITEDLQRSLAAGLALENNVSGTNYKRGRNGVLKERDVIVARPSRLGAGTISGDGTSIGADTKVIKSVLGRRCQIGKRSKIESAYIWDDTTVGNNVTITKAIIGSEVFIGDDCVIGDGALISFGVKIAAGSTIHPGARITKVDQDLGFKKNTAIAGGSRSEGWEYHEDDETDEGPRTFGIYGVKDFNESTSTLASDASGPASSRSGSRSQSFATTMSDEDPGDRFQHDTVAILYQRMQDNHGADDMLSELMGLRFSGGADETGVRRAVATSLMKHIHTLVSAGSVKTAEASRSTLGKYRTLIRRDGAEQHTDEQVLFLLDVQKDLTHRSEGGSIMVHVIKDLYDFEVFTEEAVLQWWEDDRSKETSELTEIRKSVEPFISWLEEAESESEEESDEDDEGDD